MLNAVLEPGVRTISQPLTDKGAPARSDTPPIEVITPLRAARQHYEDLLALPTGQLRVRAQEELLRENALPEGARRAAAHQRLAAWLDLDPEDARILARVYDEASAALDPEIARGRYEAECDAILHGFRFNQFTRLADFVPWLKSSLGLELLGAAVSAEAERPHQLMSA